MVITRGGGGALKEFLGGDVPQDKFETMYGLVFKKQ